MHPQWWETLRCGCISCGSGSRSEQKAHLHSLNLIQCGCAFQARECSERQINRENASAFEGMPPVRMHSPHRFVSGDSLETSGFRNETRLFKYQYDQLKPERKDAYLLEVVLLNLGQPKA